MKRLFTKNSILGNTLILMSLATAIGATAGQGQKSMDDMKTGYVYTLTNDSAKNGIAVFARRSDGTLQMVNGAPFATGGKGLNSGDIDDQGSLRVYGDMVFAVNPGSDNISVFKKAGMGGLKMIGSPVSSGGSTPISIAKSGDILYVANQAVNKMSKPNITGFRLSMDGTLAPIKDSTIEFAVGEGPAQVEFSPNGKVLFVTSGFQNENTSRVHSYVLGMDGKLGEAPGSPKSTGMASGDVGFSWHPNGEHVYVSNFRGSAIVSYKVDSNTGALSTGQTIGDGEAAACWTAISQDGKTLYVANYVSNSISAYDVMTNGDIRLLGTVKRRGASGPDTKDLVLSPDGKFLYAIGSSARQVSAFSIGKDRLPKELSAGMSPVMIQMGGAIKGLAID